MAWQERLRFIPSRNRELLTELVGGTIARLARIAYDPYDTLVHHEAFVARAILPNRMFALAGGPVRLALTNGHRYVISSDELTVSIEVMRWSEEWAVDATFVEHDDLVWSEPRFASVVGQRIDAVRVLQSDDGGNAKLEERPREAGLRLLLADGHELVFSHGLVDAPDEPALLLDGDVPSTVSTELLRV